MTPLVEALLSFLAKVGLFFWRKRESEVKTEEVDHAEQTIDSASDAAVARRLRDEYQRD